MIKRIKDLIEKNSILKNIIVPIAACVFIACFLEASLFNFRFYQSRFYSPIMGLPYTVSGNMEQRDYNIYEIMSTDEELYIDVDINDTAIENVYVDLWPKNEIFNADRLRMHFRVCDQGNPTGYSMPQIDYNRVVWQTMYTPLDLSGKCNSFRIVIDEGIGEGQLLRIDNIAFNARVPFSVSKKRLLALSIIFALMWFLRPGSFVYEKKALDKFKGKKAIIIALLIAEAAMIYVICGLNGSSKQQRFQSEHQFEMLAEALAQGKPYLLENPPQALIDMDNPYSYQGRLAAGVEGEALYDVAYYNGHYYVYFGVGPIITIYLPYYLVTGSHIPNYLIVFGIGVLLAGAWLMILYEIIRKYFKDFSFALYIACSFLFTATCGLTYVISRPSFYAVPMTLGVVSSLFGLAFWMKAIEVDYDAEGGVVVKCISPLYVCLGSLFMAYVAACRPQLLLGSFIAVILFWRAVFKDRKLFSKDSILATVCFVVPYVVIAALLMYYNFIRFGSPFDFGSNYNLTFNDLTYRGFRLDRFLYATVGFMFIPAKVSNHFPYFHPAEYLSRYQGYTADEQLLGGLFYNNLYLLSVVFIPKCRKFIKDKAIFIASLVMPVFAVVIMVVDANMAGVVNRYFVDFSWFIIIPFFVMLGYVITDERMKQFRGIIGWTLFVLAILALIHMFLMIYGGDVNGLENNGIVEFMRMQHMIEFWN